VNKEYKREPGFAQDLTDGRGVGEWKTRYSDPEARKAIRREALYLGILLAVYLTFLVLLLCGILCDWAQFSDNTCQSFTRYVGAWLAGSIGGIAYSLKWLVHTVAHGGWNIDRKLWRYFTPHLSGTLGIVVILIVESGFFGFFDSEAVIKPSLVVVLAFLSGYFSDRMIGKLSDLFTDIFGPSANHGSRG
jgi:hypothetical protein